MYIAGTLLDIDEEVLTASYLTIIMGQLRPAVSVAGMELWARGGEGTTFQTST